MAANRIHWLDAAEAAKAAGRSGAGLAIPIHYNRIVGSLSDAERFRDLSRIPVVILPEEQPGGEQ